MPTLPTLLHIEHGDFVVVSGTESLDHFGVVRNVVWLGTRLLTAWKGARLQRIDTSA